MHRVLPAALLAPLLAATAGCNLIVAGAVMMDAGPTRRIAAEYPYLTEKRLCIAVWADAETLFEYRHVQLELSEHVRAAVEPKVSGLLMVPNRQVIDYQQRTPDWDREDPAALGKRFGADRLMLIELTHYGTREPDSPHLFRGRVSANVRVYDTAYANSAPAYKTTIDTVYPPDSVGEWGSDDKSIRRSAMQAFAEEVANKFYDRMVKDR